MHKLIPVLVLVLAGCSSAITSTLDGTTASVGQFAYSLPRGVVKAIVYADQKGVGISIEPAQITKDSRLGVLTAHNISEPLNKMKIEIDTDAQTGLLSVAKVDSDAQILEIAEAAAKSAARLSLQNSKAEFLSEKVLLAEVVFDPLTKASVGKAVESLCKAVDHGKTLLKAHLEAGGVGMNDNCETNLFSMAVTHTDGTLIEIEAEPTRDEIAAACQKGLCARTLTTRMIQVSFAGRVVGTHLVDVPSQHVVAVPFTTSALADYQTDISIQQGILKKFSVDKDSELLTLVQLPAKAIGGFFAGIGEQLDAEKSVTDKEKALTDSKVAAAKSRKELVEFELQNAGGTTTAQFPSSAYSAQTLTLYLLRRDTNALLVSLKKPAAAAAGDAGKKPGGQDPKGPLVNKNSAGNTQ